MKKLLFVLSIALAFAACNKEVAVQHEEEAPQRPVVFDFTINQADTPETKAAKSAWEAGDIVYVFFYDLTTNYLKLTYDGSQWNCTDKDGNAITYWICSFTQKKLTAVYLPVPLWEYQHEHTISVEGGKFVFTSADDIGFFMTAEQVPFTITDNEVVTIRATLNMKAPDGPVQICIPPTIKTSDGYEFNALSASYIQPVSIKDVVPGGAVNINTSSKGPGWAGTLSTYRYPASYNDGNRYFWGILNTEKRGVSSTYTFALYSGQRHIVKSQTYYFPDRSKTRTLTGLTLYQKTGGSISRAAIKFSNTGWEDLGAFVDMGFGGPKWRTCNLGASFPHQVGTRYMYGYQDKFENTYSQPNNRHGSYNKTTNDPAYATNNAWRLPTKAEFDEFIDSYPLIQNYLINFNTDTGTVNDTYTDRGTIVTSLAKGISLFFPFAGFDLWSSLTGPTYGNDIGDQGFYWTSTPKSATSQYFFDSKKMEMKDMSRDDAYKFGYSVRPVKD